MAGDMGIGNIFNKNNSLKQRPTLTTDSALKALRAAVVLTKDAVNAVSVTAMDALREALALINIRNETELIDPFMHLDAPIWENKPPSEIIEKAPGLSGDPSSTERGIGSRIVINAMKNGRQSDLEFAKTNRECLENAFPEIFDRIDSKFKDLI